MWSTPANTGNANTVSRARILLTVYSRKYGEVTGPTCNLYRFCENVKCPFLMSSSCSPAEAGTRAGAARVS